MTVAYHINVLARTVTPLDALDHDTIKGILPGGPTIGMSYSNGDALLVDDEALLHKATRAFLIRRRADGQPMMSDGILIGRETADAALPPDFTIEQFRQEITFLSVDTALAWFRARASEPAVTMNGLPLADWAYFLACLEGKDNAL